MANRRGIELARVMMVSAQTAAGEGPVLNEGRFRAQVAEYFRARDLEIEDIKRRLNFSGGGIVIGWVDITDKPAVFPPDAHTHLWVDITDKPATFPPSAHTHLWVDITDKPTVFPPEAHTHLWVDITDKPATFPPEAHTHLWVDITDKPTVFPPDAHTHLWVDITDKPATFPPSAHTHLWVDITDKPATFPPSAHTHLLAEITDFSAADYATAAQGALADSALQVADILGTVSESGGVPTGSIIERGSNANGEYVRYADGTQICTRFITGLSFAATTAVGNVRADIAQADLTFPVAFISAPAIGTHLNGNGTWAEPNNVSATGFKPILLAGSSTSGNQNYSYMAIGRWF